MKILSNQDWFDIRHDIRYNRRRIEQLEDKIAGQRHRIDRLLEYLELWEHTYPQRTVIESNK